VLSRTSTDSRLTPYSFPRSFLLYLLGFVNHQWALTAFPDQIAKRQCAIYFGNLSSTDVGRARLGGTKEACSNVLKVPTHLLT